MRDSILRCLGNRRPKGARRLEPSDYEFYCSQPQTPQPRPASCKPQPKSQNKSQARSQTRSQARSQTRSQTNSQDPARSKPRGRQSNRQDAPRSKPRSTTQQSSQQVRYSRPVPGPQTRSRSAPQNRSRYPPQTRSRSEPQTRVQVHYEPRQECHPWNKPMKGILKNPGYYGYHPLIFEDSDRKRDQFMAVLAQRYPQYADRISGSQYSVSGSENGYPIMHQPRQRDHQRRRTTIVTYNPDHNRSMEYDSGTMSDVDIPPTSFQRGGFTRSSLPIVRSNSTIFDRTIGLAFLIFRDETKKALLPNEITSLDTVRALFVRSFPEKLSMDFLDSPKRKIYVLEQKSNIYFQLEDLRDIKDHSVLKIHECDSVEPQRVKEYPPVRGRSVQVKSLQPPPKPARDLDRVDAALRDEYAKSRSLPAQLPHHYQEIMDDQRLWELERRSRSQTPELDRPRSLSVGPPRTRASPERLPTPERVGLRTIPEDPQMKNGYAGPMNGGSNGNYDVLPGYQRDSRGHHGDPRGRVSSPTGPPPGRPFSPTGEGHYDQVYGYHQPVPAGPPTQTYVAHSVRAHTVHAPQRATVPPVELRNGSRNGTANRHSLTFAPMTGAQGQGQGQEPTYQRSQSYRVTPERDTVAQQRPRSLTPQPGDTYTEPINRIDKMEAQLASLAAWVHSSVKPDGHASNSRNNSRNNSLERRSGRGSSVASDSTDTVPGSSASSMSDIPFSSHSGTLVGSDVYDSIAVIRQKAVELRLDLRSLRRQQQLNKEDMVDTIQSTIWQLKDVLRSVPGANSQVVRKNRSDTDTDRHMYLDDKTKIGKELRDLECSVEELRADVISRQCRVNMADVEGMALVLSNITKALADLKARFPSLQESLKTVMAGEMEIVVQEEKFLKEEPEKLETELKRCKKLTGTLYTLKRLASVQEHRPPQIPTIATNQNEPSFEEKKAVLENIRSIVPNHDSRVQQIEAAESSRERKKKISTQQTALKMGKSLELATKALRPASESEVDVDQKEMVDTGPKSAPPLAHIPLTETTEKISNVARKGSEVEEFHGAMAAGDKHAARTKFFGDMSPPTSPEREVTIPKATMDYTVRIPSSKVNSPAKSNSANDTYVSKGDNVSRSQLMSIPQASGKSSQATSPSGKTSDKQKKVPPPPPPRKSSRLPTASSNGGGGGGGGVSPVRSISVSSPSPNDSENKNILSHKGHLRGPVSSTPKPPPPKKPTSVFEKDLVAGIYANMNRPDLQSQKVAPERIIHRASEEESPRRDERGSSSESTGSSTSMDSQASSVIMRKTATTEATRREAGAKKPKPPPPERRSSLLQKAGGGGGGQSPGEEKVIAQQHILEEQRKLEELVRETNEMMKRQSITQQPGKDKTSMNGIGARTAEKSDSKR